MGVNMAEFRRMRKQDPFHVFSRIYSLTPEEGSKSLMNIIHDATNEYITARREGRTHSVPKPKRNLKPVSREFANVPDDIVTMDGLVTFMVIHMLISYNRLPELSMYWKQQPDSGNELGVIQQVMTHERFRFISRHLACSRQADAEESFRRLGMRDPIVKIRPLVDGLNLRFQQLRRPPRVQSIDESMVKFKGRSKMRQTMKSKPIKSGFKLWSRCDDRGYTYQFEIYHGTRIGNAEAKRTRKNEATDQVVLDLCAPLANKGHIVAFDSFFTSVSVLDKL